MSDNVQPQQSAKGLIATLLSWIGRVLTMLIVSLLFSLLVEWLGITFFWPELGVEHSQLMMKTELDWFADNVTKSLLVTEPVRQLNMLLDTVWQWLFIDTGFITWFTKNTPELLDWLNIYLQATVYITLTFILRIFILALTTPLFILAALVGFVDGLVRRDIRRFGCGYESGFIYHYAKRTVIPVFFLSSGIYLSIPFSLNPVAILLPAASLLGYMISITAGSFKKYL